MSDILSTLTDSDLSNQISELVKQREEAGEGYTTVRFAAKKLNVKQTDIRDNLPAYAKLRPASDGTLSQSQIALNAIKEGEIDSTIYIQEEASNTEVEEVQQMLPRKSRKVKVETEKVVKEPVYQLDEEGNQVLDEEGNPILAPTAETESGPTVICAICGNPVRKSTIVRRGICPLCFRQLARNVGMNATKLEALSDEEFDVILGEELGRRAALEDYKKLRTLTPEQFKEREADLVPVKVVFAAAKEAGFGPGRVAQAMGGDRFRHVPLKGFDSVWTPYFAGPRNAWYFDKAILDSFEDLVKPVKEKKAKAEGGDGATGRKGARGAKMTPVAEGEATAVSETEEVQSMEETEA